VRRRLPLVGRLGPEAIASAVERGAVEMAREPADPSALAAQALGWLDEIVATAKELFPPTQPIGCAEGCAFCCHLKVIATPAEVVALVEHVERTLPAAELASLRDRVARAAAAVRGLTAEARARLQLPCPLLVDSRCIAYDARPLHCAGANASDPRACEAAFRAPDEDVPIAHYPAQRLSADAAAAGLSRALFLIGLDGRMLELITALDLAFTDPTAADRFRRGEPAFEAAIDLELLRMLEGR
jgi:hypothetical protein